MVGNGVGFVFHVLLMFLLLAAEPKKIAPIFDFLRVRVVFGWWLFVIIRFHYMWPYDAHVWGSCFFAPGNAAAAP
jgi:hypothetical protein